MCQISSLTAATDGPMTEFSSFANFEKRKRKSNLLMSFPKIVHQKGSFGQIRKNPLFRFCRPILDIFGRTLLRGEKLNYNSCTSLLLRKSQNLLFLAPEVQWALKVYRVCSIHVFFKCFEPCPYLVCHVTTIENVKKLGQSGSFSKYNNTFCQNTALSTTCSIRLRNCTIFRKL